MRMKQKIVKWTYFHYTTTPLLHQVTLQCRKCECLSVNTLVLMYFFSKWDFLQKFGEILSWVKLSFGEKTQMFQKIFPNFFPVCFQVPGILTVLYIVTHRMRSEPNAGYTCEEILRIVLNLLWFYQHACIAHTIDIFCLLVYLSFH